MIRRLPLLLLALILTLLFFTLNYGEAIARGALSDPYGRSNVPIWFALSFIPFLPMVAAKSTSAGAWVVAIAGSFILSALWLYAVHFGPPTANIGAGLMMLGAPFLIAALAACFAFLPERTDED